MYEDVSIDNMKFEEFKQLVETCVKSVKMEDADSETCALIRATLLQHDMLETA